MCVGHVDGKIHEYDSRAVLMKQVARLAERGWTLNTGLEPEFFLLTRDENGKLIPADPTEFGGVDNGRSTFTVQVSLK